MTTEPLSIPRGSASSTLDFPGQHNRPFSAEGFHHLGRPRRHRLELGTGSLQRAPVSREPVALVLDPYPTRHRREELVAQGLDHRAPGRDPGAQFDRPVRERLLQAAQTDGTQGELLKERSSRLARNSAERAETAATTAISRARPWRAPMAPGRGRAASGSTTIGAIVPSKSQQSPERRGASARSRSRRSRLSSARGPRRQCCREGSRPHGERSQCRRRSNVGPPS